MFETRRTFLALALVFPFFFAPGFPASAGETSPCAGRALDQAAWVPGTVIYRFGYNSIPQIPITGAPADTDWRRVAMLHDGEVYRLFVFKKRTNDTLYSFAFNRATSAYEYGYKSALEVKLSGVPEDADTTGFAMLHDGQANRLFMLSKRKRNKLHSFALNPTSGRYEYGHNSDPTINIVGAPPDSDSRAWAMLHDGTHYRFYTLKRGTRNQLYQFAFNPATRQYEYAYESIPILTLEGIPSTSDGSRFVMLHDGSDYRFYFLTKPPEPEPRKSRTPSSEDKQGHDGPGHA